MPVYRNFILGLFLLSGCAATPQIMWWRDDFSAEEFADDSALCLNYASARVESPAGARVDDGRKKELAQQLYDFCLTSLGYYQIELRDGRLPPPEAPPAEVYDIRHRASPVAPARPTLGL